MHSREVYGLATSFFVWSLANLVFCEGRFHSINPIAK